MAAKSFSETYTRAASKLSLPAYDALCDEFDLDTIAADSRRPLREVAKKIFERTDSFRKVVEAALQPESMTEMQEAESFTQPDLDASIEILRKLMQLDRMLLAAELENTEQAYAGFIATAALEWTTLKRDLAPIVKRLQQSWDLRKKASLRLHYLG